MPKLCIQAVGFLPKGRHRHCGELATVSERGQHYCEKHDPSKARAVWERHYRQRAERAANERLRVSVKLALSTDDA